MAFKSYSWSIGTTSFRTSQLNYKIERQLQLLKEFWKLNPNSQWNSNTQKKYYNFLKENDFIYGDALRPDKDAREKTSGLVNIGVITDDRRLTAVGNNIENLLYKQMTKDNIFFVSEDSYYYLLQMLKLQIVDGDIKIRPFIALLYMIEKLDYLSYEEFTYLLPLCKNKYDVKKMVETIKANRMGLDINEI
ncbi:MAG: AlwI family type II restriction endonuclease, partial [Bacilli bacterium]